MKLGSFASYCFLMEIDYAGHPGERRAVLELVLSFTETRMLSSKLKTRHGLLELLNSTGTVLFFIATLLVLPAGNWQEILVFINDYRILAYICLIYFFREWLMMDRVNWFLLSQEWSFHSPSKWLTSDSSGQETALRRQCFETLPYRAESSQYRFCYPGAPAGSCVLVW